MPDHYDDDEFEEEFSDEQEEEEGVYVASASTDGVDKKDLEDIEYKTDRLELKNESLNKENKKLRNLLSKVNGTNPARGSITLSPNCCAT